jgi:hypothetical protein
LENGRFLMLLEIKNTYRIDNRNRQCQEEMRNDLRFLPESQNPKIFFFTHFECIHIVYIIMFKIGFEIFLVHLMLKS